MNRNYLPTGNHGGLHIVAAAGTQTGPMMPGAGHKIVLHTTEGLGFLSMDRVLRTKGAEPHFLLDPRTGQVKQYMGLSQYARALEHPSGTQETNRAGCIQIEVCEFAAHSHAWPEVYYDHLAHLCKFIMHRVDVPNRLARRFINNDRFTPSGFIRVQGILGHKHVPSQPSGHWDPGSLKGTLLTRLIEHAR